MKINLQKSAPESIEAIAFAKGTQDEPLDDLLEEIEADFEKLMEEKRAVTIDEIKRLEAESEIKRNRKDEATSRWEMIDKLHDGRSLEFAKPVLAVAVAALLIVAEGALLAPTMDGINISEPWAQLLVATLMVTALSGFIEVAIHNFHATPRRMWLVVAFGGFGIAALSFFGWWRGEESIFAARELGTAGFAAENPTLTRIVMLAVTVGLPIVAAFALDFGIKRLRLWLERRMARREFLRFTREAEEFRKKLDAAREKLAAEIDAISQQREAWMSASRDNFEKGRTIGAWKAPFWQAVILPTVIVGIIVFVVVMTLGLILIDPFLAEFIASDPFRITLLVLATLGITGIFAMMFIRRWNRPTVAETFRQRATHWRNADNPNALHLNDGRNRSLPAAQIEAARNGHQSAAKTAV